MPELSAAQREQGQVPVPRKRWTCPVAGCSAFGYAQNGRAAYLAGTRHFEDTHDRVVDDGLGIVWLCDLGNHDECQGYACTCPCHDNHHNATEGIDDAED